MARALMVSFSAVLVMLSSSGHAQSAPPAAATQDSVQELVRRVEALERILAPLISQSEQNQRGQQLLRAQVERLAQETFGELAAMRAELAKRGPVTVEQAKDGQPAAQPVTPTVKEAPAVDYLARAREAVAREAWSQAEYDASAQLALTDQGKQAAEANHLLGRSLLGQGHVASAAEKFLLVYDSQPPAALAAENLYFLGEALRKLALPDNSQLCAVYAETLQQHGTNLDAERIAKVRASLAEENCA